MLKFDAFIGMLPSFWRGLRSSGESPQGEIWYTASLGSICEWICDDGLITSVFYLICQKLDTGEGVVLFVKGAWTPHIAACSYTYNTYNSQ